MLKIGLIGYGYWGPNIARNINSLTNAKIVAICDKSQDAINRARAAYPNTDYTCDYREIISMKEIDAVMIATPVVTHYLIAKNALENGKNIFVEKPFTTTSKEAEILIKLAEKKNLKIMVDHTYLFSGAVKRIKKLMEDNVLGDVYYYDSRRVNLGLFQHDVNVVWDLAPHDLSVMDYILGEKPSAIVAHGIDHFGRGLEDIAYITAYFNNCLIAHFNINWLSPVKIRTTCIGGKKKMLVWNDLEADEKIKIYDRGVEINSKEGIYNLLVEYRSGDMWAPKADHTEALSLELEYFIDCILSNKSPITDGHMGLRIVKMLEAANKSLKNNGKMVKL